MIPELLLPILRERTRQERAAVAAIALIGASVLFGGQSGPASFVQSIPQLLAVGALAWLGGTARRGDFIDGAGVMFALAAAMCGLIALQLVPLPYPVWTNLPARAEPAEALRLAVPGMPWRPLSLDPGATLQSALTLLPALAMLGIGATLDREGLRRVMLAIAACALVSLVIGWVQLLGGIDGPLYVYGQPEARLALGLFANRNHQADMLCVGLLVASALQYFLAPQVRLIRRHRLVCAAAVTALFGIGTLFTASRFGNLVFLPCAGFAMAVAFVDSRRKRSARTAVMLVLIALVFVVIGWASFSMLAQRVQNLRDLRFTIWPDAWYLAQTVWTSGTGFGTFVPAYQRIESLSGVTPLLVNAAHDDYLQLLIEGGAAAIALLAAFFIWFGWRIVRLVRLGHGLAGWFAAAGLTVLLVHSAVDYPLRTEALSTIFAALTVILNAAGQPLPASARHLDASTEFAGER